MGGFSTKIHVVVDALGFPVDFVLTPGQAADIHQAGPLLSGKEAKAVIADKGYDADRLLAQIERQGTIAVIPPLKCRTVQRDYDRQLYKERNAVERFFNRIKQFRGIATRYMKTSSSFLALFTLACIYVWLS